MRSLNKYFMLVLFILCIVGNLPAAESDIALKAGNTALQNELYEEAATQFLKAYTEAKSEQKTFTNPPNDNMVLAVNAMLEIALLEDSDTNKVMLNQICTGFLFNTPFTIVQYAIHVYGNEKSPVMDEYKLLSCLDLYYTAYMKNKNYEEASFTTSVKAVLLAKMLQEELAKK